MTPERRNGPNERRHGHWLHDRVMLGLVASILCSVVLFVLYETQGDSLDSQSKRLTIVAQQLKTAVMQIKSEQILLGSEYISQVESCKRLNILRVEDNISHRADYNVFKVVLIESQAPPVLTGVTPEQQQHELTFRQKFLTPLARAVKAKTWTPRTDCAKAVNKHGARFRAPKPIPFMQRPPTLDALRLYPSDFQ